MKFYRYLNIIFCVCQMPLLFTFLLFYRWWLSKYASIEKYLTDSPVYAYPASPQVRFACSLSAISPCWGKIRKLSSKELCTIPETWTSPSLAGTCRSTTVRERGSRLLCRKYLRHLVFLLCGILWGLVRHRWWLGAICPRLWPLLFLLLFCLHL